VALLRLGGQINPESLWNHTNHAPFRFIELLAIGDWTMKLYGIAWRGERPRQELLETARRIADEQLAQEKPNDYRVGFIGAHDGWDACLVFVDFWGNENELFHRVFLSRSNDPKQLTAAENTDSSVCVWDLRLQSFEREAWIKYVLRRPNGPDFEGYLAERLNENG
jgi:hypothetical protein